MGADYSAWGSWCICAGLNKNEIVGKLEDLVRSKCNCIYIRPTFKGRTRAEIVLGACLVK